MPLKSENAALIYAKVNFSIKEKVHDEQRAKEDLNRLLDSAVMEKDRVQKELGKVAADVEDAKVNATDCTFSSFTDRPSVMLTPT